MFPVQGDSAWELCDSKNIALQSALEILCDLAAENNLVVDTQAFEAKLEEHKGTRLRIVVFICAFVFNDFAFVLDTFDHSIVAAGISYRHSS